MNEYEMSEVLEDVIDLLDRLAIGHITIEHIQQDSAYLCGRLTDVFNWINNDITWE